MPTKSKAATAETIEDQAEYQGPEDLLEDSDDWDSDEGDADATEQASQTDMAIQSLSTVCRLEGKELLAFYEDKKAAGRTHAQIAYAAGYYTVTKAGRERVMQAQFNESLLEAQGIETGKSGGGGDRSHAGLTKARVSGQGILLVSQLATRHIGAEPGAVFAVEFPAPRQILLTMTDEVKPVIARKPKTDEQPGTPLLDPAQAPA